MRVARQQVPLVALATLLAGGLLAPGVSAETGKHDASAHLKACSGKLLGRPFSDQDEKIHRVITLSGGDEDRAFQEMADRYGISVKDAREAYQRVDKAEKGNWAFAMMDAFHETVSCLVEQHGLKLLQPAAPAGTHLYVFVDSPTDAPNPMDRIAEDVLLLEGVETATVQFHVKGEGKIRRDYPQPPKR